MRRVTEIDDHEYLALSLEQFELGLLSESEWERRKQEHEKWLQELSSLEDEAIYQTVEDNRLRQLEKFKSSVIH